MVGHKEQSFGRFDFRAAVCERKRAIHKLETLLQRCADSGVDPDRDFVAALQAVITGQRAGVIDLRDS